MTYSLDFRKKVLEVKARERLSFDEISKRFSVGKSSVVRWSINIKAKTSRNKGWVKIDLDALRQDVEKHPDSYQYERAERFGVSQSGICVALKRLKISCKKNTKPS